MKILSNHKGFTLVESLLIVLVLTTVSGLGFYVFQSQNKPIAAKQSQTSVVQKQDNNELKTYTSDIGKFSVQYPSDWILEQGARSNTSENPTSMATLKSPSGKVSLNLNSDGGGRGGSCEPSPNDKPYQPGNACPTSEILSIEPLAIDNVYYSAQKDNPDGSIDFDFKKSNVVLATSKYADPNGAVKYIIGATNADTDFEAQKNVPYMGAYFSIESITVYDEKGNFQPYVYVFAITKDASYLKSPEAETLKEIIRSLKINI